jgi:hypothetical protein
MDLTDVVHHRPNNNQLAKAIHITARGIMTVTTSLPTVTWTVRAGSAGTSGPILLTASVAMNTVTAGPWTLEGDVIVSVMGAAGAHSTVQGYGHVMQANISGNGWLLTANGTAATLDTSVTNFINVNCLISASANTITCQQLLVYGLN